MTRLFREASPRAARRLIELIDDLDTRVASVVCLGIQDRAWGKHFDPASVKDEPAWRIDPSQYTIAELKEFKRLIEKGAVQVVREQDEQPEELTLDVPAQEVKADGEPEE